MLLLHVVEHFPEDLPVQVIAPEDVDPKQYLTEQAASALKEFAENVGLIHAPQHVTLTSGPAGHEILAYAKQHHATLIVLGTHSGANSTRLLGSTCSAVLQGASCDVLSVR